MPELDIYSAELVKKVAEHCGWRAEVLGEGVVRLMGERRTRRRRAGFQWREDLDDARRTRFCTRGCGTESESVCVCERERADAGGACIKRSKGSGTRRERARTRTAVAAARAKKSTTIAQSINH
jgi:hypothetical protein